MDNNLSNQGKSFVIPFKNSYRMTPVFQWNWNWDGRDAVIALQASSDVREPVKATVFHHSAKCSHPYLSLIHREEARRSSFHLLPPPPLSLLVYVHSSSSYSSSGIPTVSLLPPADILSFSVFTKWLLLYSGCCEQSNEYSCYIKGLNPFNRWTTVSFFEGICSMELVNY